VTPTRRPRAADPACRGRVTAADRMAALVAASVALPIAGEDVMKRARLGARWSTVRAPLGPGATMHHRHLVLAIAACGSTPTAPIAPAAPTAVAAAYAAATPLALPGAGPDGVLMDYLLYNPRTRTVWAPAGNTGAVDVVDTATGHVAQVTGFPTQEVERRGKKRTVGPSAAALGEPGTVYIGSRGDSSVCAVDEAKLARGACGKLDAMPDGILYVPATQEVWVTTPRDQSIRVLDGTTLAQKARIAVPGAPEGFAVDATRHRFYTNLEDKDQTLAIDLTTRAIVATWQPQCGEDGPHGIRLAEPEGILVVACDAQLRALDVGKTGAILSSLPTGEGVDDLDYVPASHAIFAGAGKAGTLTVATVDAKGTLTQIAVVPTKPGARNPAAAATGAVYLANSAGGELVVVAPARP
jgi:DNA-binding beta-propeller fold protein YncE